MSYGAKTAAAAANVPAPREGDPVDPYEGIATGWRVLLAAHAAPDTLQAITAGQLHPLRAGGAVLAAMGGVHSASRCPDCARVRRDEGLDP